MRAIYRLASGQEDIFKGMLFSTKGAESERIISLRAYERTFIKQVCMGSF